MGKLANVLIFLLCIQVVAGIGYAPLGIYGIVEENGGPVEGATVIIKGLVEGEVISEAPVVETTESGEFYTALTVRDGQIVDVEITVKTIEPHIEIIEDLRPWDEYTVTIELAGSEIIESTTPSQASAPTSSQFDADYELIESGEVSEELIDRYDIIIEEWQPYEPVVEEPTVVENKEVIVEEVKPFYEDVIWQFIGIILVVICIVIIRHEAKLHRS